MNFATVEVMKNMLLAVGLDILYMSSKGISKNLVLSNFQKVNIFNSELTLL
jgi:hypothetical protein